MRPQSIVTRNICSLNTVLSCFSQQLHWTMWVTQISNTHYRPGRYRNSTTRTDCLPQSEAAAYNLQFENKKCTFDHYVNFKQSMVFPAKFNKASQCVWINPLLTWQFIVWTSPFPPSSSCAVWTHLLVARTAAGWTKERQWALQILQLSSWTNLKILHWHAIQIQNCMWSSIYTYT